MDTTQRIVTQMPLAELWNNSGPLDARRGERLGEADIVQLLREGSSLVIADVGQALRWMSKNDRFAFWKTEVKNRLVASDVDKFYLGAFPGSYCYVATMWECASDSPVVVLEKHH